MANWSFLKLHNAPPKPHVRKYMDDGDEYAESVTPAYFEVQVRSNVSSKDVGTTGYYYPHGYESKHAVRNKLEKLMGYNADWDVLLTEHKEQRADKLIRRQFANPSRPVAIVITSVQQLKRGMAAAKKIANKTGRQVRVVLKKRK